MGRLVINNAMTVNGAFEAPSPDEWLVLDPDSNTVSLEQFLVADAMVLGRKTYPVTTRNVILEELHVGTEGVFTMPVSPRSAVRHCAVS